MVTSMLPSACGVVKESLRPCEFGGYPPGGLCRIGPGSVASPAPSGDLRAPVQCVTGTPRSTRSALANSGRAPHPSPLCIRACVLAGHDAFGQGVLGEAGAQARRSLGEPAHVDADERPLFCPAQLFLTALHGSRSVLSRTGKVRGAAIQQGPGGIRD